MNHPMNLITFKEGTPNYIKQRIFQIYNGNQFYFKEKILFDQNSADFIEYFSICRFSTFYTFKTQFQKPLILKTICSISFPNLVELYLQKLQISNFQALQWIDSPHLTALYLMENNAISFKTFGKTHFKQLKNLQIDGNFHTSEFRYLAKMKLNFNLKIKTNDKGQNSTENNKGIQHFLMMQIFKIEGQCGFLVNNRKSKKINILYTKLDQKNNREK